MPQIAVHNLISPNNTWQQELKRCVTDPEKLLKLLAIEPDLYAESFTARKLFPLRVPLPFIQRMEQGNINDPLLQQVMTSSSEFIEHPDFVDDPLDEHQAAMPGLLHKYHNRVLLMVRTACAINCRYCFRRQFPYQENSISQQQFNDISTYVEQHQTVNEVILSGGDPLMASDNHLAKIFSLFEPIEHVTRLRIHTRLPVVIPSRITEELLSLLKNSRLNIVMVLHINHANEIDEHVAQMCQKLKNIGVTLLNQAVLLKGINDNDLAQVALCERLFSVGIMPYYLHLLDKVRGATHFDTTEADAILLMHQLYKSLPGFLVPKLVREIGGQAHKTPIDLGLAPVL